MTDRHPVRYIEELAWRLAFDPVHQAQVREHHAASIWNMTHG